MQAHARRRVVPTCPTPPVRSRRRHAFERPDQHLLRWRSRGLFDRLCAPDALVRAAHLTTRGKRQSRAVAGFIASRAERLAVIHGALVEGTWRPWGYALLPIFDPKPRLIAVAPVADRVVHTALVEAMTPVFTPSLMPEDFACRAGYGVHRAVYALRRGMQRHRFAVHLDVRAFFASVETGTLMRLLRRKIADARFLGVLDHIFQSGVTLYRRADVRAHMRLSADWPPPDRGLPIGTATSQFLATHVYLNGLDHFVKRALKVPTMVRFVDDIICFGDHRSTLRRWRDEIGRWLLEERGLRLKHPQARVIACAGTLNALGHRIRRDEHAALPRSRRRFVRRARGVITGSDTPRDVRASVASGVGVRLF